MLFADLVGFTPIAESRDAEDVRVREQEANLARARSQKRLEVLDEEWRSLARRRAEPREYSPDLERKLDEVLREVRELPRIAFNFNRSSFGRLRQMIDTLNSL